MYDVDVYWCNGFLMYYIGFVVVVKYRVVGDEEEVGEECVDRVDDGM